MSPASEERRETVPFLLLVSFSPLAFEPHRRRRRRRRRRKGLKEEGATKDWALFPRTDEGHSFPPPPFLPGTRRSPLGPSVPFPLLHSLFAIPWTNACPGEEDVCCARRGRRWRRRDKDLA